MELVRLPEAARQLGVSYPTLKQWIYKRKIKSVRTAGGHHRIPRAEIDRLVFRAESGGRGRTAKASRQEAAARSGIGLEHVISGRNQLVGRVITVRVEGLLAEVRVDVGGQTVTSIITSRAASDLKLKAGETVAALIKATEVMIIRPPSIASGH
jgi:molybdopterin-binding protein